MGDRLRRIRNEEGERADRQRATKQSHFHLEDMPTW
jgi:hypothetical protein